MNEHARITAARSFAVDAVTALEQHVTMLLGIADILAQQCHDHASREMRRALERSKRALCAFREELAAIEVIERYLARQQEEPMPPS